MIKSSFMSSKKCAAILSVALAGALTACSSSSPDNAAQNAPAPPAQNPPAAVQNPPQPAPQAPSMSVADLTAPSSAPAAPNGPARNPPPQQQGALASAGYAPRSGGMAPPPAAQDSAEYAQVISVTPLSGVQQVCSDQTVTERRPQSDDHQVAGTVIGAIAGGVIGNQFGRGNGRKLTTVAGAVGGGIAGKKIQEAHQDNDTVTRVVKRCRNVTPGKDSPQLYEVVYAYQGQNLHVKLDYDPGSRIALPVRGVR